ncbi:MAG: hypothetical protein QMD61_00825 [Methanobacterium sp.]|nr:hypothetical protein [Methanobacterium sp.]
MKFRIYSRSKNLSSRGLDNKPFAQINAETKGKVENQLTLDGSSIVDPSGNPLKEYK